jgi:glycosyltransferase involved in cell wall biosynthesis
MTPVVSIVIPAFNRIEPLRLTLRTAAQAAAALPTEIVLVDDGSTKPLRDVLESEIGFPVVWIRQANAGSMVARHTGLLAAQGEFVLFLDSDDIIHPEKLVRQTEAMRAVGADISYSDMAVYRLGPDGEPIFSPGAAMAAAPNAVDFFLRVQPTPHNPIYRRDYLLRHLAAPLVPLRREYDPVGDVWIYFNLLQHAARIVKVDAALTAIGVHEEGRYSGHWEHLGFASLRLMEDFLAACPATPATAAARTAVGECAFVSWRKLPRDFAPRFGKRLLDLWRQAPRGPVARLGERNFARLAAVLGAETAARLLRFLRGHSYSSCRTLDAAAYAAFLAKL